MVVISNAELLSIAEKRGISLEDQSALDLFRLNYIREMGNLAKGPLLRETDQVLDSQLDDETFALVHGPKGRVSRSAIE